jgi:seryl-tRNA synthetase
VIDIKRLRQDPEAVRSALRRRLDPSVDAMASELAELDRRRREALVAAETLKASRNAASEEVARRKKAGTPADDLLAELKKSSERSKQLEAGRRGPRRAAGRMLLLGFPISRTTRCPTAMRPRTEWCEPGARSRSSTSPRVRTGSWANGSGSSTCPRGAGSRIGFPALYGQGARLVRALANFMLDLHTREHGYTECARPTS